MPLKIAAPRAPPANVGRNTESSLSDATFGHWRWIGLRVKRYVITSQEGMLDAAKQIGSEANYIAVMVAEFGEQHRWRVQVRGRDGEDALPGEGRIRTFRATACDSWAHSSDSCAMAAFDTSS